MASPSPDPGPIVSVVLPAHNEAANIQPMVTALHGVLAPFGAHEILFVDDGSRDGTPAAIRAAAAGDPAVRYLLLVRNFGKEPAIRAGLRAARGRAVAVMDCDFEHPPEVLAELVGAWRKGSRVVVTRRIDNPAEVPALRRLASRLFHRLLDAISDVRMEPGSSDFMLLDRSVVEVVNRIEDRDVFLRGLVRWFGYPTAKVDFKRGTRRHGATKFGFRSLLEIAVSGIAAHSVRPLRLAIYLALGAAGASGLLILYSLFSFFFVPNIASGWTSLMAAIGVLGAAQLLVLGIVGEYVGRLLSEVRRRPLYLVAESSEEPRPEG
ncbi:MAG: glycosyltransferase family 2 protein [Bauldia sp.]